MRQISASLSSVQDLLAPPRRNIWLPANVRETWRSTAASRSCQVDLAFHNSLRACHLRSSLLFESLGAPRRVPLPIAAAGPWIYPPTGSVALASSPSEQQATQLEGGEHPAPHPFRRHAQDLAPRSRLRPFPSAPRPRRTWSNFLQPLQGGLVVPGGQQLQLFELTMETTQFSAAWRPKGLSWECASLLEVVQH